MNEKEIEMEKEKTPFEKMWSQYKECYYRPLELDEKLRELEARFASVGAIDYAKVPMEPSSSFNRPLYYVTYKEEIRRKQKEYHEQRITLEARIESLIRSNIKGDAYVQIARKRMLDLKPANAIADELGYTAQHVGRIVKECFQILNRVKINEKWLDK